MGVKIGGLEAPGVLIRIGQFRYINIQPKTIDITTRLRGINPTNSIVSSLEPRTEAYCFRLNLKGTVSRFGACPYYIFACARFIARPAFSLFMNQSEASCLISHANSHKIINRGINPTGQN